MEDLNVRGADHAAGILVETSSAVAGTATLLKAIRSEDNQVGLSFVGDGNEVRGSNGVKFNVSSGIQVIGNNNLIVENDVEENHGEDNTGCEFDVEAGNFSATGNTVNDETVLPDAHGVSRHAVTCAAQASKGGKA